MTQPPTAAAPVEPNRRPRPPLTEQIRIIRELWLLRERARVRAAEQQFIAELERLLGRSAYAPPPPPPLSHPSLISASSVAPPIAPPPPAANSSRLRAVIEAAVYESHPPPRNDSSPVRERRDSLMHSMEVLRARQPVTNLSAQFRARLERNEAHTEYRSMVRSRSFGQLTRQRAVSAALDSGFRHQLEALVARAGTRSPPNTPLQNLGQRLDLDTPTPHASHRELSSLVTTLRQEVAVLKNVMSASFDLQLDIQRAIRQEVCAAMGRSDAKHVGSESCAVAATQERVARAGACTVCLEKNVDCVLYACGHMCTCSLCARQLLSAGQKCPICRATVRDVIRAFIVTDSAVA